MRHAVVLIPYLTALGTFAALVLSAQAPAKLENTYAFRAADNSASPRIARLRRDIQNNGASALEQFWNEMRLNGAPIIESIPGDDQHSLVTFVWQGSASAHNVVIADGVAAGVGGVDPVDSEMTRIPETDVWYRTYDVRNDARFTYALSENDPLSLFTDPNRKSNSRPDPLNPNRFLTGQTYVELRNAPPQRWITPRPPEVSGNVENTSLNARNVWVYTPRDFRTTGERYPLVVVMGGSPYMNFVSVTANLDNLIAEKRIPPVVAVIVGAAAAELSCSPAFADFLANELVPWMRSAYHATDKPAQTVIGGSSLGGLASTFAAVQHPGVFGKVLSQSGSYWWNRVFGSRLELDNVADAEWLTRQVAAMPRLPLEFFLEAGLMEIDAQLGTNRRMRDTLIRKGYAVHYQEFNGNHSYIHWRGSFGEGLIALLGD